MTDEWFDLGQPHGRFNVIWQEINGKIHETEVDANGIADAAFRVADMTFDGNAHITRQLLDVVRLR